MKYLSKKKVFIIVAVLLIITFLGNMLISFAATSRELQQQHNQTQSEINDTKEEQEKIRGQMTKIQ